jgi:DNA-binding response OmpR family regulator
LSIAFRALFGLCSPNFTEKKKNTEKMVYNILRKFEQVENMNKRVLIVDDEENICELLKLELELDGYVCETALDGTSALAIFEAFHPDLVLLDLMLPGISGIEVCKEIAASSDVPVIMLTAKSETSDKIAGLEIGADDYITKPFDTRELLARIKALIRRYDSIRQNKAHKLQNLV